MPGIITKTAVLTNLPTIYRTGGIRLIVAALTAKTGTPFLTVFTKVVR